MYQYMYMYMYVCVHVHVHVVCVWFIDCVYTCFVEACCSFWARAVWRVSLFKRSSLLSLIPWTCEFSLLYMYSIHSLIIIPFLMFQLQMYYIVFLFSSQDFMVGLNFASEEEAEKFCTAVESKITYARRASKPFRPDLFSFFCLFVSLADLLSFLLLVLLFFSYFSSYEEEASFWA